MGACTCVAISSCVALHTRRVKTADANVDARPSSRQVRHFAVLGLGKIGTTVQDSWKDLLIGEAAAAVIPLLADKQEQVASAAALSLQNLQNDDSLAALMPYVLEVKGTPLIMQAHVEYSCMGWGCVAARIAPAFCGERCVRCLTIRAC